ncbi:MAG: hypothetical protein KF873_08460 [Gemmataceae bacterium]|nr:hypothetical protein [Gemmataceae bacterium]
MNRASWLLFALFAGAASANGQSPKNQVVVLDDGTVLEGVVQTADKIVRVSPVKGVARVVTAAQVSFIGDSRESAYDFVAKNVDANTPDGARRLAVWCEKAGLPDKALVHAKSYAVLAPNDSAVRDWIATLEKRSTTKPVETNRSATSVRAPVELASGSAVAFAARIQPILSNQCASCHAAKDYSGAFQLGRVAQGYANPEVAAANLKVATSQLEVDDPANSPLLKYALTAHGGQKRPAFPNRDAIAYRHLEAWVFETLPKRDTTRGFATESKPAAKHEPVDAPTALPGAVVGELGRPAVVSTATVPAHVVPRPVPTVPKSAANANDPFDPTEFNRRPKSSAK